MLMRRNLSLAILPALLLLSTACPPKHPDPQAQQAQIAIQALQRVGELQDVAIALNQRGEMPDADAVRIVRFTTAAARTIRQTPYGWGSSFLQAYDEIRPWLLTQQRVTSFVPLIDIIVKGLR